MDQKHNGPTGLLDANKKPRGRSRLLTRRQFLRRGAAGTAAGTLAATIAANRALAAVPSKPNILIRPTPPTHGYDPALLRLIDKATYGFSRATYNEAEALGYDAWLEQQLNPATIDDSAMDARLAAPGFASLTMTSQQIVTTYGMTQQVPVSQLVDATVLRAVFSKRQLFERMVGFWTDHINIDIQDGQCRFLKTADDRDVIRQHALGTFPALLSASAHSGAMSYYLDNYTNVSGHAQENYAREAMELHTMGVDGGYSQEDVEEVARCFTGWAFFLPNTGQFGGFWFRPQFHDNGSKSVLGNFIPANGGQNDGETVINILAFHPSTARYVSKKLCAYLLGYSPSEDVLEIVTQTYLATGGDIKAMLRVILQPSVLTSLSTPKLKRPFHFVSSLLRATNATITSVRAISQRLQVMGHVPFHWPEPDGYPDSLAAWGSAILPRWQFASDLIDGGAFNGVTVDTNALMSSEGGLTAGQQGPAINRILSGGRMPSEEQTLVQGVYDDLAPPTLQAMRNALGAAASMPSFQWY